MRFPHTISRPAVAALLAILATACSLVPAEGERVRAKRMEDAVLPMAATALEAGQTETARRLYRRLLDVDPESVQARMGLGDVALRERETAAAARWYLAALTHAEAPGERHAALLAHGRAALAAGQLEAGRESFTRLTDPDENAPRAAVAWGYNGVGLALLLEGDLRGAVASMEQAVLRAPGEARFQGNLDRALAMLGGFPAPDVPAGELSSDDKPSRRAGTTPGRPMMAENAIPAPPGAAPAPAHPGIDTVSRVDAKPVLRGARVSTPEAADTEAGDRTRAVSEHGANAVAAVGESEARTPAEDGPVVTEPEEVGEPVFRRDESIETTFEVTEAAPEAKEAGTAGPQESVEPAFGPGASVGPVVEESDQPALDDGEPQASEIDERVQTRLERIEDVAAEPDESGLARFGGGVREGEFSPDTSGKDDEVAGRASDAEAAPGLIPPRPAPLVVAEDGSEFLQFGAYAKLANAEGVAVHLRGLTERPVSITETVVEGGASLLRVRIGPLPSRDALLALIGVVESHGYRVANPPPVAPETAAGLGHPPGTVETQLVHENGERFLQAGAFRARAAAENLAAELRGLSERPVRVSEVLGVEGLLLHRVRIGPLEPNDPLTDLFDFAE